MYGIKSAGANARTTITLLILQKRRLWQVSPITEYIFFYDNLIFKPTFSSNALQMQCGKL
jgi:hypothetical protein